MLFDLDVYIKRHHDEKWPVAAKRKFITNGKDPRLTLSNDEVASRKRRLPDNNSPQPSAFSLPSIREISLLIDRAGDESLKKKIPRLQSAEADNFVTFPASLNVRFLSLIYFFPIKKIKIQTLLFFLYFMDNRS